MANDTQKIKVNPPTQEPTNAWKRLTNEHSTPDFLGFAKIDQDMQVLGCDLE